MKVGATDKLAGMSVLTAIAALFVIGVLVLGGIFIRGLAKNSN